MQWHNTLTKVPAKYADYTDIFSYNLVIKFPKNKNINKHAIELVEDKQVSYSLIYTFNLIELEILKAYIKTYQKTKFIWLLKYSADALIFFDKKCDGSLHLGINYWGLNNLTIKNQYSLSRICKTPNWLSQAKQFI